MTEVGEIKEENGRIYIYTGNKYERMLTPDEAIFEIYNSLKRIEQKLGIEVEK